MNAQVQAWRDQEDAHDVRTIRQHGWLIQYVFGDDTAPPFAYTIGLFGLHHPELLIVGVPHELASLVVNQLGDRIRAGDDLVPGRVVMVDGWPSRIVPEPVPNPAQILLGAVRYYGRPVPALQLSYEDRQGRFPWEEDYSAPHMQPRPGTFTA